MGILGNVIKKFKKKKKPEAVATIQYTAPIGPTSKPMTTSTGETIVYTPTGRQSYGGGSAPTKYGGSGPILPIITLPDSVKPQTPTTNKPLINTSQIQKQIEQQRNLERMQQAQRFTLSNQTYEQIRRRDAIADSKAFLEKNVIARTSSGKISLPGSIAKPILKTGDYLGKKTGYIDAVEGIPILDAKISLSQASDIITSLMFAPLMSTGTYSQQVAKQLSKNKFNALKQALDDAEMDLIKKTSGKEQAEYLKNIYSKLTTSLQKENFKTWVKSLADKEIIKINAPPTITKTGSLTLEISGLPTNKLNAPISAVVQTLKSSNPFQSSGFDKNKITSNVISNTLSSNKVNQNVKTQQRQNNINLLGLTTRQATRQGSSTKTEQIISQPTKQLSSTINILGLKTKLKSSSRTAQQYRQRHKTTSIFGFKNSLYNPVKVVNKATREPEYFEFFGRRRGKDILLGKASRQDVAELGLKKFLTSTLGASGFISKGGQRQKINLGFGFEPSKKDNLRIVQKKKFRLSSGPEKSEIQRSRKKKPKKLKFF